MAAEAGVRFFVYPDPVASFAVVSLDHRIVGRPSRLPPHRWVIDLYAPTLEGLSPPAAALAVARALVASLEAKVERPDRPQAPAPRTGPRGERVQVPGQDPLPF